MQPSARRAGLIFALTTGLGLATTAPRAQTPPAPRLHCEVTYAGTTHTVLASPVADPYPVESVDIGGRFRFKAVMVGKGRSVDYIKLYSYLETRRQPVLVQQVRYLPPYPEAPKGSDSINLTGMQYLYAGPVERELQYQCTLQGAQP